MYISDRTSRRESGLARAHVVLDNLAVGEREATILSEYPSLTRANIRAALAFAADLAHDRILPIPA